MFNSKKWIPNLEKPSAPPPSRYVSNDKIKFTALPQRAPIKVKLTVNNNRLSIEAPSESATQVIDRLHEYIKQLQL